MLIKDRVKGKPKMNNKKLNVSKRGLPEQLRQVMRHWTTGVAVVTSSHNGGVHGMTVNSFTSVSLDPPVVAVTLANVTRTFKMVLKSGMFGITILHENQAEISERFAGKILKEQDRFDGVETFFLEHPVPLIAGGCAYLNCRLIFSHPLPDSTLLLGEVVAADAEGDLRPLVYLNRGYHRMENPVNGSLESCWK
jgi:flavin reductase (DIM6/NTAB) family NADH-FMN oxidoreductase RutF